VDVDAPRFASTFPQHTSRIPDADMPWRPFLVLVANVSEGESRSLEDFLGTSGYAVLKADSGRRALELARTAQPDAIILGSRPSDIAGTEICRVLRDDPRFVATTPIILTASERDSLATSLEAYSAGAWDFSLLPLAGPVLPLKLRTLMRAKRESERWRDGNLVDTATGLYNTQGLMKRAQEIGADARRRQEALACVALAPFTIADGGNGGGTVTGPLVQHVAAICRRRARGSDVLGHLSETELGLIAPATSARGAIWIVRQLRALVETQPFDSAGTLRAITLRAAYCATLKRGSKSINVMDMLLRAASAMREQPASRLGRELGTRRENDLVVARIP
jgi:PleD family two-component response regulator